MSKPANLERMKELTDQLEVVFREAQIIRERLAGRVNVRPCWPNRSGESDAAELDHAARPPQSLAPSDEDRHP